MGVCEGVLPASAGAVLSGLIFLWSVLLAIECFLARNDVLIKNNIFFVCAKLYFQKQEDHMVIHKKCGKNEKCKIINFALSSRSKKVRLSQGQNLGLYFWDFKKPQRSKSAVLPFF